MLEEYAAEIVVFGKENLKAGANTGIAKATEFLTEMFKNNGMGDIPIHYGISMMNEKRFHQVEAVSELIRSTIEKVLHLA